MARTVRSIIQAAQRKFGALVSGDNTSADEMTDGLEAYNGLVRAIQGDWLAPVESARPYRVRHGGSGQPLSRPGLVHHHHLPGQSAPRRTLRRRGREPRTFNPQLHHRQRTARSSKVRRRT